MSKHIHFNREDFITQTAGSEDIAKQVAELYHRDIANDLASIDAAFSANDFEQVRRLAHKSKSGFIIMGARDLYDLALRLETRAKQVETDLTEDLQKFRADCEALDQELCAEFQIRKK